MFNRSKFNNGKFNTISGSVSGSNATILMNMDVVASGNTKFALLPNVIDSSLGMSATATRVITSSNIDINFLSEVSAVGTKVVYATSNNMNFEMEIKADSFNAFGFEVIKLNARGGLALRPNDELRIDTEKMTVELNGVNVIKHFSSDSDFFKLKPSENILLYSNGIQTSKSEVKILWKDRWL